MVNPVQSLLGDYHENLIRGLVVRWLSAGTLLKNPGKDLSGTSAAAQSNINEVYLYQCVRTIRSNNFWVLAKDQIAFVSVAIILLFQYIVPFW